MIESKKPLTAKRAKISQRTPKKFVTLRPSARAWRTLRLNAFNSCHRNLAFLSLCSSITQTVWSRHTSSLKDCDKALPLPSERLAFENEVQLCAFGFV